MASKNVSVFLLGLIFLAACHKSQTGNIGGIKMSDYPVKVNDSWTYQVVDSINHITDTAVFTITAKTVVNSDSSIYNFQTTVNGEITDSGIIAENNTGYSYYYNTGSSLFSDLKFVFPITIYSAWQGEVNRDTSYVVSTLASFTVLGKTYSNVYIINRHLMEIDYDVRATVYVALGVGIVQENVVIWSWLQQNKTVRLINYNLH